MTVRSSVSRLLAVVAILGLAASAASVAPADAGEGGTGVSSQVGGDVPSPTLLDGEGSLGTVPTANCEVEPRQVQPGEEVTLDASGSERANSVEFDYDGDGDYDLTDSEDFVVTVSYRRAGTYEPRVQAVGDGNETVTCGEVVVGNPPPTADITYQPSSPVIDEPITFDGTGSSDPDGSVTSYEWYVDGQYVNGASAFEFTISDPGTYRVRLVVTDDDGATDEATTNVTIEPNDPPEASLSASSTSATTGETVTFDASASTDPDGEVVEYRWDLDGDGTADRTTDDPTLEHAYEDPGSYTGTVEVVDDDGATDGAEVRIDVEAGAEPVARCTVEPAEAGVDEAVVVDARETTGATAVRVDVDGDGTFDRTLEDEFVVEVRYDEPGTYRPRIQVVEDVEGADARTDAATCGEVVVENRPPTAALAANRSSPAPGETVAFDASNSADPDGEVVEYRWDLDGDGTVDRTTAEPAVEHAFEEPGTYAVTVQVVDEYGATDTAEVRIEVVPANEPPTASFTNQSPSSNGTVTFDASDSADADGEVVEYRWDLDGDGTVDRTTQGPTLEHTYEEAQNATVVLQVVDDDGATDSTEQDLRVGPAQSASAVSLTDLLLPLLLGGVTAAGVAWWRARRRPKGDGKPKRKHYPKPKPTLLSGDAEYYAAGTFEVPAAGTSTVSITDVGFEPDLVLCSTTNADRVDAFPPRSESWSTGAAMATPEGIEQHVTVVADDASSTDQATVSTTDGDALAAVRHGEGPPEHVRGRIAATTPDGFEVVVSGVADPTDAGRVGVHYRAFALPYEAEVETGHFRTPVEPGVQTVELGVDADHVALTASSAVGDLDRQWTTDRSVGLSAGMAVGPSNQTVTSATAWPGHDAAATAFGATDRALYLPYLDGDRIAGRTSASVVGLGERLALRYDRLYSGPEKIGWTEPHVVSYVALNGADVVTPAIGTVRLPAPGERAAVDLGFEPGMVEFATCGAGTLGAHDRAATAPGPFASSTGTAVVDDGDLVQYVLQGTGAATPPPGATVAGAVDPAGQAATDGAGGRVNATPDGAGDEVNATTDNPADQGNATPDGADDRVNATPDGRVATVLPLDEDGIVSGRDDLRVETFTDDGFRLSVESVSTDGRDPDAETRPYVFYRAWPAVGADAAGMADEAGTKAGEDDTADVTADHRGTGDGDAT